MEEMQIQSQVAANHGLSRYLDHQPASNYLPRSGICSSTTNIAFHSYRTCTYEHLLYWTDGLAADTTTKRT